MKKLYTIIVLTALHLSVNAQIITIPDANFKTALVNTICVDLDDDGLMDSDADTNNDNEIDVSEALAAFTLFYTPPPPLQPGLPESLAPNNIADLTGIEYFTNLKKLNVADNLLTTLDLTPLSQLQLLRCGSNPLASLNVSNLTNLQYLYCEDNQLANLDVSTLSNIKFIHCSLNLLTSLNVSGLSQLEWLSCATNQLTQIVFGNNTSLQRLYCADNFFQTLDLSDTTVSLLYCDNNAALKQIFLKNGVISPLQTEQFPFPIDTFSLTGLPALEFVCGDEGELDALSQSVANETVNVASYCSFTPGGNFNTITGSVIFECGTQNLAVQGMKLNIEQNSETGITYSATNGNYGFYAQNGSATVTVQPENPEYFTITPASFIFNFETAPNFETADFCLMPNGIHHDVAISIIPIGPARPGFDAVYKIVFRNKGNQTASGTVTFQFHDPIFDFISSSMAVSSMESGVLTWDFSTLLPFESREILLTLNLNGPTEIPPVNVGDLINHNATITNAGGDEFNDDDSMLLEQIVVGAVDPNDKTVSEIVNVYVDYRPYLNYTIRFQNVGTAPAENVVIKDVLSDFLNPTTVEITSASHNYRSTITEGNKLEFFFENINLPAEADNEPASHGYVAFKVKLSESTDVGDVIENQAAIYFDFNFPVITNITSTTVGTVLTSSSFSESDGFKIYPNPADNLLNIETLRGKSIESIVIYNTLGQAVKTIGQNIGNKLMIEISNLARGIYYVQLNSDKSNSTVKLLKK